MQLLSIKNELFQIAFSTKEQNLLTIYDFVKIQNAYQTVFAKIVAILPNVAIAKFALALDFNGKISKIDLPKIEKNPKISKVMQSEIVKFVLRSTKMIKLYHLADDINQPIYIDIDDFKRNVSILATNFQYSKKLIDQIIVSLKQNNQPTIVLDFEKKFQKQDSYVLKFGSENFKLPFNSFAIDYLINYEFKDILPINKIKLNRILNDLKIYINNVDSKFIFFDTIKKVVFEQLQSNKSFELMILNKKLEEFSKKNIFYTSEDKVITLEKYFESDNVLFISNDVDNNLNSLIIRYLNDSIFRNYFLIANIDESLFLNRDFVQICQNSNIFKIYSSLYNFKYNNVLLKNSKVVFKFGIRGFEEGNKNDMIISELLPDSCFVCSDSLLYIPFVISPQSVCGVYSKENFVNKDSAQYNREFKSKVIEANGNEKLIETKNSDQTKIDVLRDVDNNVEDLLNSSDEKSEDNEIKANISEDNIKIIENRSVEQEDLKESKEVDISSQESVGLLEKVDKVAVEDSVDSEEQIGDEISVNDLDELAQLLKEDKNSLESRVNNVVANVEMVGQSDIEERQDKLPIFDAIVSPLEFVSSNDGIEFKERDKVFHTTYGKGIIEKIVEYSDKKLYSINFENVGIRLLDPNLAKITKYEQQ